ncbi:hypothetical protein [Kitasatospora sp. NPDC059571]|uniref:hypothetical protein n=1 Tax=Kitasatospora sp. NPDC059571 TaxID=3346871 RepID=UPI00369318D8
MARPLCARLSEAEFRVPVSQASTLVQHRPAIGHEKTAVQQRLHQARQLFHVADALSGDGQEPDRPAAHDAAARMGTR